MSESKLKRKFEDIVAKSGNTKITGDQLYLVFKNPSNKYTTEKIIQIAKTYVKPYLLDGDKLFQQYETNIKKQQMNPFDAMSFMLSNATVVKHTISQHQQQKPQIASKPTNINIDSKITIRSDTIESPILCSTRMDLNTPEIIVSEIKEKLAQATQQSNHQTSRSTSNPYIRQSLNSSSTLIQTRKFVSSTSLPTVNMNPIPTWTFSFSDEVILPFQMKMPKPIVGLPASSQERQIIQELLYTLIGINGSLIIPKLKIASNDSKDEHTFVNNWLESRCIAVEFDLNEQITDSIKDILKDILPLANYYFKLQYFIESSRTPESGQVLQALSAALSKLIDDYYGSIAQLESIHLRGELNLHKLLFYLRPIITTMETITRTCGKLQEQNLRGGNVLTNLHDSISLFSGDKNSQQILIHLTQKAAEPYMEILRQWIFNGIIQDPRGEFFVEDSENKQPMDKNENYFNEFWEKRYIILPDKIPRFLDKQSDMILRTGKYLNIVRECGKRVIFNQRGADLKFSHTDENNYMNLITDAYSFASKALMELILKDNDLMGHLLSVKRYFLLQQGDFIVQFMEACEHELMKSVDKVIPMRLENLLELTLRLSSAKYDKYQDNLSTFLMPFDIFTQMSKIINSNNTSGPIDEVDFDSNLTGIECFSFDYKTAWPITIILNQLTISKYQIIFRQLFYLKHVENFLCRVWIANNNAKKFDHGTSEQYRAAFTLRQRMMNAVQNLEYYMMIEVIEPVWHVFMQQISKAKNFDDILTYHEDFLDKCLRNCMLKEPDVLRCIMRMCSHCIGFCQFIEEAQRHFIDAELSSMLSKSYISDDSSLPCNYDQKENVSTETFSEKVNHYDTNFTQQTVALLNKIHEIAEKNHSEKYISLIHRINFNHFYSDKLNTNQ